MLEKLANLDRVSRRTIYLVLFVVSALPFLVPIHLPLYVWRETRQAFDVTDGVPPTKVVAICSNWIAGSQGENWPQYEAVVAHLMVSGKKFIVFALDGDPVAPQMAENINERQAKRYGRKYGVDWVNLGLARGAPLTMGSIGRNVKGVFQRDFRQTPTDDYTKLPIMRNVNTGRDIGCLWDFEYTPNLDWTVFLDPSGRTPILFGGAGIVSSGYYPYLSSGQLKGLLVGTRGGAEYEELIRQKFGKRFDATDMRGQKLLVPLAFGHLIIILFVVVGNVGMIARARMARKGAA